MKVGRGDHATRARPCALLVKTYAVTGSVDRKRMRSVQEYAQDPYG